MPSYRTSLTLDSLRELTNLLDDIHQQGGMSDGLIDARKAIKIKLSEVDAGYARPNNVTKYQDRNSNAGASSASNANVPDWVNDSSILSTTDKVLKQAYTMAINIYVATDKYPPSLDPYIAEINAEQDKVKMFFNADDL